jgi:hypothetical protein
MSVKKRGKVTMCKALTVHVCKTCGKEICRVNWIDYVYKNNYKHNKRYYCSYNCMRRAELEMLHEGGKGE